MRKQFISSRLSEMKRWTDDIILCKQNWTYQPADHAYVCKLLNRKNNAHSAATFSNPPIRVPADSLWYSKKRAWSVDEKKLFRQHFFLPSHQVHQWTISAA